MPNEYELLFFCRIKKITHDINETNFRLLRNQCIGVQQ